MKHVDGDVRANLERHEYWLTKAVETGAHFVGFPEFSMTGWVKDPAEALRLDSEPVRQVGRWAKRYGIYLATGLVERRGRRRHNTCVIFGPRGCVGAMRKVNPIAKELEHYTPGREFPVFNVAGCRMGVATCADASRYEMFHVLSLRGAEVIFAPHANSLGAYGNSATGWSRWRMERWPVFTRDACVAVLGVNCAGSFSPRRRGDEPTKYCGGGMVMDWTGRALARAPVRTKRECVLPVELDLSALRKARADRRNDSFQKKTFYRHLV